VILFHLLWRKLLVVYLHIWCLFT